MMVCMTYEVEYERLFARTYDSVYAVIRDASGDSAFYRSMVEETGGPLLELGCGTGRVLLNSAETGLEYVGIDASNEMLDVLRDGDRFWYERTLSNDEYVAVANTTLADIIRRNTTISNEISDNVFIVQ